MSTIETIPHPTDTNTAPASGQANNGATSTPPQATVEGFESWIKDFQKYESILAEMTKVSADSKFKDELATIEHWFKVLNESERTAALYSLLQHSTQDQIRFFVAVLQQKLKPEEPKPVVAAQESPAGKPKLGKLSFRPPSLNLPDLGSPTTPTPITARESAIDEQSHHSLLAQAALNREAQRKAPAGEANWANMVNTPLIPIFQKDKEAAEASKAAGSTNSLPGFSGINPYTLNMLANAGLSNEAQLLAAQLVMSGLVQPAGPLQQGKLKKGPPTSTWRTPASARFPSSALKSSGLRPSSSLKSAGLKSSGLQSATPLSAIDSPREEDFNPEMLKDIPGWLRTLRLHKYTQCFEGLPWEEMVVLDDATLEAKGVAALGARRRLLRTFEHVRKTMGIEGDSATPTTTTIPATTAPRSKLSINSPIFTPTWGDKTPNSAIPIADLAKPVPEVVEAAATVPEAA